MHSALRGSGLLLAFALLIGAAQSAGAMTEKERDHLRMIGEWLPYVSCQESKFLKQCYQWSTEECEGTTERSAQSCLKMYETQWMDPMGGSLEHWQEKIIDCVHRDIHTKLPGRAVASMTCKNKGGG